MVNGKKGFRRVAVRSTRKRKFRKNNTRAIAQRALRISRNIASSIEVKAYSTADVAPLVPISGLRFLPLTGLTAIVPGSIHQPLRGLIQGSGVSNRIGERIKVKYIDLTVSIDSLAGAATEYMLSGARYQFVVFQVTHEPSRDANFGSDAGRYWDLNSAGQVLYPTTTILDSWAPKTIDSRRWNTRTIVRRRGVIKPCTSVTADAAGAFVRGTALKSNIFKGRIKLPVDMITYIGNSSNNGTVNDVIMLLVLDSRTNAALDDQCVVSSVVYYTDA